MLTQTVEIREAKKQFAELLSLVRTGTEIILTEGNQWIARLTPVTTTETRLAGLHTGAIWTSQDFDKPLSDEFWMGESDEAAS